MPKIEEFYLILLKEAERSDTLTLGTLAHFRHFRPFLLESNVIAFYSVFEDKKLIFRACTLWILHGNCE